MSIEDIADHSGVSRQTVYKYFSGKQAIVEAIAYREMQTIGRQIRVRTQHAGSFAERLTEALLVSDESCKANR